MSACLSVGHIYVPCKTAEPIEMPFAGPTLVRSRTMYYMGLRPPTGSGSFGGCQAN